MARDSSGVNGLKTHQGDFAKYISNKTRLGRAMISSSTNAGNRTHSQTALRALALHELESYKSDLREQKSEVWVNCYSKPHRLSTNSSVPPLKS